MERCRFPTAAFAAVLWVTLALGSSPSSAMSAAESCKSEQYTVSLGERLFGAEDTEVASARKSLARCLAAAGDYQGAAPHYQQALETWRRQGFIKGWFADELDEYAELLEKAGRAEDAAAARARAAALRAGR